MSYTSNQEKSRFNPIGGLLSPQGLTVGGLINIVNYTGSPASGTYTPTPGTKLIYVEMVGGGGGSASAAATSSGQISFGAPGCPGGCVYALLDISYDISGTYSLGSGGTAGQSTGTVDGGNGGNTVFTINDIVLTAGGGSAGYRTAASSSDAMEYTGWSNGTSGLSSVVGTNVKWYNIVNSTRQGYAASVIPGAAGEAVTYFDCNVASFNPSALFSKYHPTNRGLTRVSKFAYSEDGRSPPSPGFGSGPSGPVNRGSSAARNGIAGSVGAIIIYEYA